MSRFESKCFQMTQGRLAMGMAVICMLVLPVQSWSTATTYMYYSNPATVTTACVNKIRIARGLLHHPDHSFVLITKYLTAPKACTAGTPAGGMCSTAGNNILYASVATSTAAGFGGCNWNCGGTCGGNGTGTITTNQSDGLPVELMEFSVDDEHAVGEKSKLTTHSTTQPGDP